MKRRMEQIPFTKYPRDARRGIISLVIAWLFLIGSQAVLFGRVSFIQLTIGLFCCVVVYTVKNWGRMVCVVYNLFLIALIVYSLYVTVQKEQFIVAAMTVYVIDIILFAVATYFLLSKETSSFYKGKSE